MKQITLTILLFLTFSCYSSSVKKDDQLEYLVHSGYKLIRENKKQKAYLLLEETRARRGDLAEICKWKDVDFLKFRNVSFELEYFSEAADCKDLERIVLVECNSADIEHFHLFPSLNYVALGGKTCTDSIMQPLSQIKNLSWLLIGSSPITSQGVKYLANAKKIEQLNLEDTEVDDTVFQYLIEMPKLKEVSLRRTKVTREAAHDFRIAYQRRYGRQIYLYTQQRSDLIE